MSDPDSNTEDEANDEGELPDAPTEDDPGSFVDPVRPQADEGETDDHEETTDDGPPAAEGQTYPTSVTENAPTTPPGGDDTDGEEEPEPGSLRAVMDELKEQGIAEDVDMDEFMADHSPVKEPDEGEEEADYVAEWRERVAKSKGDDTGAEGDDETASETSDGASETDTSDEPEPLELDGQPVTSKELGLLDDDLDLSGLQEQQEITLSTRGYDITYRDPDDEDGVTNAFRGLDDPENMSEQRRVAAQLAVSEINGNERPVEGSDQCITDGLWYSFSPPVRVEIGLKSMNMLGFLSSLGERSAGRAPQRDAKSDASPTPTS